MKRHCALLFFTIVTTEIANAGTTIVVTGAWSRPAIGTAVVYAILRNPGSLSDRLIGGTSPVATRVELHESFESSMPATSSSTSMGDMPMGGSMVSMKSLAAIPIPARGTTTLAPGGYHLMLDLRRRLRAGQTIPLRLHFAQAGWVDVNAYVKASR